ncbi:MAG TPA: hypothetical protein VMU69_21035 [Bradyrhizobium sp.]|nr:hypothetical protein [Bradyrhizobium sp.]
MKISYSIEEEQVIAERSELIVRGLTLGTVSDNDVKKTLRVVRLCATRANDSSTTTVSSARHEVALASLDLIVTLKNLSSRDQKIARAVNAVEAWKRELATL